MTTSNDRLQIAQESIEILLSVVPDCFELVGQMMLDSLDYEKKAMLELEHQYEAHFEHLLREAKTPFDVARGEVTALQARAEVALANQQLAEFNALMRVSDVLLEDMLENAEPADPAMLRGMIADVEAMVADIQEAHMDFHEEVLALAMADPTGDRMRELLELTHVKRMEAIVQARVEDERLRFESGDSMALQSAIDCCFRGRIDAPDWVRRAHRKAYLQVRDCHTDSWDVAFGSPYPKGTKLPAMRNRREKRMRVYIEIIKAHRAGRAIGPDLFEEIGERVGVRKTLATELYYQQKARIGATPLLREVQFRED